jgi:hypothetical protein
MKYLSDNGSTPGIVIEEAKGMIAAVYMGNR